jgi:hypothetical protein
MLSDRILNLETTINVPEFVQGLGILKIGLDTVGPYEVGSHPRFCREVVACNRRRNYARNELWEKSERGRAFGAGSIMINNLVIFSTNDLRR